MIVPCRWLRISLVVVLAGLALNPGKCQDQAGLRGSSNTAAEQSSSSVAGAAGQLICKGPYIQFPSAGNVVVMWEALSNLSGVVRYGEGEAPDRTVANVHAQVMKATVPAAAGKTNGPTTREFYVYEAALRELKPGTTYSYRVELGGMQTPVYHFKTFIPGVERTRFIVYGDTRSDPPAHTALAKRFRAQDPDFILHTGDLVAKGRDYSLWGKEFFTPMAGVINELPFFSVLGNHEEDGTNYLAYFHLPGNELWYSFDVGPVHILALDFQYQASTNEQFRFAEQDLTRSRAPWKLVVLHTPLFNIGGHASDWGQTNYLPLFHRTKVDLVLSGHSHLYERFRPLAPRNEKKWAITHVTTGGGGANLHRSFDHPALVVRETVRHYMVFEATRDKLEGEAIRADGSVLDRFELTKSRGRMSLQYLAQVYPEELLATFYDALPSLNGSAVSAPGTNEPAKVVLKTLPLTRTHGAATLEISLAPDSAPYYEMDNGPTRTATPAAGQTNQVVWTSVRSTGRKAVTTKSDGELVPPLIFMAKVRSSEGETLSYGSPCRVTKAAAELLGRTESGR
jgi:acid phosphatase type 7